MSAPLLKIAKGTSDGLGGQSIIDGQLLITTDTKRIYIDHNNERLGLGPIPISAEEIAEICGAETIYYGDNVQL